MSMKIARVLPLLVTAALVAGPAHAAPRQLDARTPPNVTGPLELEGTNCTNRDVTNAGEVIATTQACVYLYSYDVLSELDLLRDYGVAWLQTNVTPKPGWCTTRADSELSLPADARIEEQSPGSAGPIDAAKKVTAKLIVAPGPREIDSAEISQAFRLFPSRLVPSIREDSEGNAGVVSWNGKSPKKLGFATGLEYSWDALSGPPARIGYGLSRFGLETCKPSAAPGPTGANAEVSDAGH